MGSEYKRSGSRRTAVVTYATVFAVAGSLSALLFFGPGTPPDVGSGAIYVAVPALAVVAAIRLIIELTRRGK